MYKLNPSPILAKVLSMNILSISKFNNFANLEKDLLYKVLDHCPPLDVEDIIRIYRNIIVYRDLDVSEFLEHVSILDTHDAISKIESITKEDIYSEHIQNMSKRQCSKTNCLESKLQNLRGSLYNIELSSGSCNGRRNIASNYNRQCFTEHDSEKKSSSFEIDFDSLTDNTVKCERSSLHMDECSSEKNFPGVNISAETGCQHKSIEQNNGRYRKSVNCKHEPDSHKICGLANMKGAEEECNLIDKETCTTTDDLKSIIEKQHVLFDAIEDICKADDRETRDRLKIDLIDYIKVAMQGIESTGNETPLNGILSPKKDNFKRDIFTYIVSGDSNAVYWMIHKNRDVLFEIDDCNNTPLHIAARHGKHLICRLLVSRGAKLEAKNVAGRTPLQSAEDDETRKLLIELGSKINSKNNSINYLHKGGPFYILLVKMGILSWLKYLLVMVQMYPKWISMVGLPFIMLPNRITKTYASTLYKKVHLLIKCLLMELLCTLQLVLVTGIFVKS